MNIQQYGAGLFTVSDFLSESECDELIAISEQKEYEIATIQAISGPQVNTEIRNNDRIIFDDGQLADRLFLLSKALLPQENQEWVLHGLNERFRFYRYDDNHYFEWHGDGTFVRNEHEESMLTFIIYLNDGFEEGYTQFAWEKIYPETGMLLVFPHRLHHRAVSPKNGIKYVLRTDVIYSGATVKC